MPPRTRLKNVGNTWDGAVVQRNRTSFNKVMDLVQLKPNSHQLQAAILDTASMKIPGYMPEIGQLRRQILQSIDDQMSHAVLSL
jgi:hypothetical protein